LRERRETKTRENTRMRLRKLVHNGRKELPQRASESVVKLVELDCGIAEEDIEEELDHSANAAE